MRERQQQVDVAVEEGWRFLQGVAQPGRRIKSVERSGSEQALDGGGSLAGALRNDEQSVLLGQADRADCVSHGVVIDRQRTVDRIAGERRPALEAVFDGLRRAAAVVHRQARRLEPIVSDSSNGTALRLRKAVRFATYIF